MSIVLEYRALGKSKSRYFFRVRLLLVFSQKHKTAVLSARC
jgi:hypothetical protein